MTRARAATTELPRVGKRAASLPPDERRSMIVAATLPLLLEHGEMVTTRQIADAAGIAEGTIFRVFSDKDAVISAVLEAAVELLQQRVVDIWRLVSSIGTRFHDQARRPQVESDALVRLFDLNRARLTVEPVLAARLLRAFTLSVTHPMLAGEPMAPPEIVALFLHGVCAEPSPC